MLMAKNWDRMSRDETRRMQDHEMSRYIREQIYPFSPYYRRLFDKNKIDPGKIRSTDDLKQIPFTRKEDIAPTDDAPTQPRDIVLQPDLEKIKKHFPKGRLVKMGITKLLYGEERVRRRLEWEYKPMFMTFTTGRTANPTPFFYSLRDLERLKEGGRRIFDISGASRDMMAVNAFPYAPHLAFWQVFFGNLSVGLTTFHSGGGRISGTERILRYIDRLKPQALAALPGYMYHLVREGGRQGFDVSSLERLITGGERLSAEMRIKLKEELIANGCDPMKIHIGCTYAFTEARLGWGECERGPDDDNAYGYHTCPDMEFLETIDPKTGERVGEGEPGEVVYSSLDWRGSCVIRYRTGDLAEGGLVYGPCPNCGRTSPRIMGPISRSSEVKEFNLTKIKGTLVDLNAFHPILGGHPDIMEWQIELNKKDNDPFGLDQIVLNLAVKEGADREALKKDLVPKFIAHTEVTPNEFRFFSLDEMLARLEMETALKELRIIDKRP